MCCLVYPRPTNPRPLTTPSTLTTPPLPSLPRLTVRLPVVQVPSAPAASAPQGKQESHKSSHVPVPVPVYCRPLMEKEQGMKVGPGPALAGLLCSGGSAAAQTGLLCSLTNGTFSDGKTTIDRTEWLCSRCVDNVHSFS